MHALADDPLQHQKSGGLVLLAGREDFLDLGSADDRLDDLGPELARHRLLHPVGQVVDDVVIAELDLVALGRFTGLGVGTDVEADDRSAAGRGEDDVALGDGAHSGVQDPGLDVLGGDPVDRAGDRLDRALDVALDDERELDRQIGLRGEHVLEIDRNRGGALPVENALAIGGDLAGAGLVLDDGERVAGGRNSGQAEHLDGHGRAGFLHLLALVVDHRPDLARDGADHEDVANP